MEYPSCEDSPLELGVSWKHGSSCLALGTLEEGGRGRVHGRGTVLSIATALQASVVAKVSAHSVLVKVLTDGIIETEKGIVAGASLSESDSFDSTRASAGAQMSCGGGLACTGGGDGGCGNIRVRMHEHLGRIR